MGCAVDHRALREARERAGLTQHELARRVGVAGGERIARWERGASEPRPDLLLRLAEILDLVPRDLLRIEGDHPDLRALRLYVGLGSTELVERAHLSRPTYLRWEEGRWERLPARSTLQALAAAFGVTVPTVVRAFRAARADYTERRKQH